MQNNNYLIFGISLLLILSLIIITICIYSQKEKYSAVPCPNNQSCVKIGSKYKCAKFSCGDSSGSDCPEPGKCKSGNSPCSIQTSLTCPTGQYLNKCNCECLPGLKSNSSGGCDCVYPTYNPAIADGATSNPPSDWENLDYVYIYATGSNDYRDQQAKIYSDGSDDNLDVTNTSLQPYSSGDLSFYKQFQPMAVLTTALLKSTRNICKCSNLELGAPSSTCPTVDSLCTTWSTQNPNCYKSSSTELSNNALCPTKTGGWANIQAIFVPAGYYLRMYASSGGGYGNDMCKEGKTIQYVINTLSSDPTEWNFICGDSNADCDGQKQQKKTCNWEGDACQDSNAFVIIKSTTWGQSDSSKKGPGGVVLFPKNWEKLYASAAFDMFEYDPTVTQ